MCRESRSISGKRDSEHNDVYGGTASRKGSENIGQGRQAVRQANRGQDDGEERSYRVWRGADRRTQDAKLRKKVNCQGIPSNGRVGGWGAGFSGRDGEMAAPRPQPEKEKNESNP